jgi:hypothetical protein
MDFRFSAQNEILMNSFQRAKREEGTTIPTSLL